MEYTDAPVQDYQQEAPWGTMKCPYCGTILPSNATHCTNCDWTLEATKPAEPKASDAMAILLSIIPGLGHIYKGHRVMGAFIMFLITPLALTFAIIAAVASAGWGILMLIPYWGAVMLHAWAVDDRVHETPDTEEQY
jgi:TM2 domain-containing membrane protein YozV